MNRDQEIKASLNDIRSKHVNLLFHSLWRREEGIYHKDLADILSLSPSGLNSLLKRVEEKSDNLIRVEIKGKFKKYYLTEDARHYFTSINSQINHEADESDQPLQGIFLPLQRFAENCGKIFPEFNWKELLSSMAQGKLMTTHPLLEYSFQEFIKQYKNLLNTQQQDDVDLNRINDCLANSVLCFVLRSYISKMTFVEAHSNDILPDDQLAKAILIRTQMNFSEDI